MVLLYDTIVNRDLVPVHLHLSGVDLGGGGCSLGSLQGPAGFRLWLKRVAEDLGARLKLLSRPRSRYKHVCVCLSSGPTSGLGVM